MVEKTKFSDFFAKNGLENTRHIAFFQRKTHCKNEDKVFEITSKSIADKYLFLDAILIRDVTLPQTLQAAIENKLRQEQEALEYEFKLLKESKEAERKRIEAEGVRDAQKIIKEGITEGNIKWKSLEVLREISTSPNAKLIITDGNSPVLINGDD